MPYRRESFIAKRIVLDFDGDVNMADAASLSNDARGKSLEQIYHAMDSLNHTYDSVGRAFYQDAKRLYYQSPVIASNDSAKAVKRALANYLRRDSC